MNYKMYNKRMKLPKKVYLITALLLFIGGGGTVLALQPEDTPKKVEVQQVSTVKADEEPKITETVNEETPAPQPIPPAPISSPAPQPKSIEQLQEVARITVMNKNKCASEFPECPQSQANCYVQLLEFRYGWSNVTEEIISSKANQLYDTYVNMCPALDNFQRLRDRANAWS